jgi:hypothetical protein
MRFLISCILAHTKRSLINPPLKANGTAFTFYKLQTNAHRPLTKFMHNSIIQSSRSSSLWWWRLCLLSQSVSLLDDDDDDGVDPLFAPHCTETIKYINSRPWKKRAGLRSSWQTGTSFQTVNMLLDKLFRKWTDKGPSKIGNDPPSGTFISVTLIQFWSFIHHWLSW